MLRDVFAGYGGGDVLQGLTLEVEPAAVTCIVGPNGAGKSTVLRTISGLLRPREGTVHLAHQVLSGLDPADIVAAGVVQVQQQNALFAALSVKENVLLGGYLCRRDKAKVRRRYEELSESFPIIAERAGQPAGNLSGGQRRMVEFARALMLEPQVVLLDEPSLGLDPRALVLVTQSIERMREAGISVLLVEQNVRFGLGVASHAVVMESGRVLRTGSAAALLADPEIGELFLGGTASPRPS